MKQNFFSNSSILSIFFKLLLLSIILPESVYSYENQYHLSAGFSLSTASIKSRYVEQNEDGELEDETKSNAFGITSRFGHKYTNTEVGFLSDIGFGKVKDVTVKDGQTTLVNGDGHYRHFSLGPYIKQIIDYPIQNKWKLYFGGSPLIGMQTLVISNVRAGENFNTKKRISFENIGAGIFLGIEEDLPHKEMHPTFFEVGFSYMVSNKVSIVDASNFKEVKTLSSRKTKELSGTFFFFRLGCILF